MNRMKNAENKNMSRPRKPIDTSTYSGRFAERLRALRDKTGMSADAFAEKHGFARTTFYNWESGTYKMTVDGNLVVLSDALGIKLRTLFPEK